MDMDTGELSLQVSDGMINNYCETIIKAVRCNMDIKFIGSGVSAKAILYYITDYITKTPLKTQVAYAALQAAVSKLCDNNQQVPGATDCARTMLIKCMNALIAKQELPAPQVASYLLGYDDFFTSHKFRSLFWTCFVSYVQDNDPTATDASPEPIDGLNDADGSNADDACILDTNPTSGQIECPPSQLMDYLAHGHSPLFEQMNVWGFVSWVDKVHICSTSTGCKTDDDEADVDPHRLPWSSLNKSHPHHSTHILRQR
jgi:hypothetical protein